MKLSFSRPRLLNKPKDLATKDYQSRAAQDCRYIVVSQEAKCIGNRLEPSEKGQFFELVRKNMFSACDYIRLRYPFSNNALANTQVADLKATDTMLDSLQEELANTQWNKPCEPRLDKTKVLGRSSEKVARELIEAFYTRKKWPKMC